MNGERIRWRSWLLGGVAALAFATASSCNGSGESDAPEEGPLEPETTTAVDDVLASLPAIQGLLEVPLLEAPPDSSDESYVWERAYRVANLAKVNVGRPTAETLGAAGRNADEAGELVCLGTNGSVGCGHGGGPDFPRPALSGITYGGPDVLAWAWVGVPEQAVVVRFTDHDGVATWQRPIDGLVIFPDTIEDDPDGDCACRFDALDEAGDMVLSVDIRTGTYVDG